MSEDWGNEPLQGWGNEPLQTGKPAPKVNSRAEAPAPTAPKAPPDPRPEYGGKKYPNELDLEPGGPWADQPGRYYFNFLPRSVDEKTGESHYGLSQNAIVRALRESLMHLNEELFHGGDNWEETARRLNPDTLNLLLGFGGPLANDVRFLTPESLAASEAALQRAAALAHMKDLSKHVASPAGKAEAMVSERATQDMRGKATATGEDPEKVGQQQIDELTRMRQGGKPAMFPDVGGRNVGALTGRVARTPGVGQEILTNAMTERDKGAAQRLIADINRYLIAGPSAYRAFKDTLDARSVESRPLYQKALAGGSLAPLREQFEKGFADIGRQEKEAAQALEVAKSQLNAALAKQPVTGGNVYSTSAANQAVREAQIAVHQAESNLQGLQAEKEEALAWLRRAQDDIANNTPGAVWSPRLQRILSEPRMQPGLHKGYELQRIEAVAEDKPFNPHELAIDETGKIIRTPNMKTLDVAKKGLDALVEAQRNTETGRLSQEGVELNKLRRSLVDELDRLNVDYKAAREKWAGHSASLDALKFGRHIHDIEPEKVAEEFNVMSEPEKDFVRIGARDALKQRLLDVDVGADEGKRILNTEWKRMQHAEIFRTREEFDTFVQSVTDERTMRSTMDRSIRGSQTAERLAEDAGAAKSPWRHFGSAGYSFATGHVPSALAQLGRGIHAGTQHGWFGNTRAAVDEEIARLLVNPSRTPSLTRRPLPDKPWEFGPGVQSGFRWSEPEIDFSPVWNMFPPEP